MFDIRILILELRPDLRRNFRYSLTKNTEAFLIWMLSSGIWEYAALRCSAELLEEFQSPEVGLNRRLKRIQYLIWKSRPDLQQEFPLPKATEKYIAWFYTHGLEEYKFWNFLTTAEQAYVLQFSEPWHSRIRFALSSVIIAPEVRVPFKDRPLGVNLIGYAFGQLGIGEDARMAARALLAVNFPVAILNFSPGANIPQNDHSMQNHVTEHGSFAFNIFCMTALENGRYYAERGLHQFRDRYNIGYWPWELSRWPKQWETMLDLVDEVWVSSQHTFDALAPVCSKPIHLMPMAVELGEVRKFSSIKVAREHFGLPPNARLFCFSFDLNSSFHRKNPQACIDAFLQAFPSEAFSCDKVGLVIKVHRPTTRHVAWEKLKTLAKKDPRIHIIENTLSRPDLLALYKACDSYVSLHRAEGFGRGIAEALQLGLYVITTGYSGNLDFCRPPNAGLVRYQLVKLKKGQYPHGDGQVWADVDVTHAAELMRKFVSCKNRREYPALCDWSAFSAAAVGVQYRQRLEQIWRYSKKILVEFES